MSLPVPSAARPLAWNAPEKLAPRIGVALATAFLSLALSQPALSAPPEPVPPPFPVGSLSVSPVIVQPGNKPQMVWSTALPSDANASDYMFYIRQHQLDTHIYHDTLVQSQGETLSGLPVGNLASTYQLWAVKTTTTPPSNYLLDSRTIGTYLPLATVTPQPQDAYRPVTMTRADQPISVKVTVGGILTDPGAPEGAKSVRLVRHAQSYGATGTGSSLDRTQAILISQTPITTNQSPSTTFTFPANQIPGENRAKVRGEERFTIYSAPDYQLPSTVLASQLVQVWPVADGSISGITQGQIIGTTAPPVSFQLNDLYPDSWSSAVVYKGLPQTGVTGTTIPGSAITLRTSVPENKTISVAGYDSVFDSDGIWTMELLTQTIFGTDRLAQVSFIVRRTGTTISDWRQTHFGSSSNTGDGADQNDYDHDGIPNVIEFAFGFDPKQANADQLPQPERTASDLAFRFTPPANITGIRYSVESSTTLQPNSWTPIPNTGALPEQLFTLPTAGKPSLYLRLTAEEP